MGEEIASARDTDRDRDSRRSSSSSNVIDIHPLSGYYFSSKEAIPDKDETLFDRIVRMKSNYAATGMRTCVQGVLLVELFRHPHVLLLQVRNSFFKLPGGRLRPGESEIDGLKRKLSSKLSVSEDVIGANWQIGESLGMWWKPDFETLLYPYLPPNVQRPKECTKLFLVKLPMNQRFVVPQNLKLLAVPLCQIHGNHKARYIHCLKFHYLSRLGCIWMHYHIELEQLFFGPFKEVYRWQQYAILRHPLQFGNVFVQRMVR